MNVIYALLGVALLLIIALLGAGVANLGLLFGVIVPYAAIVLFIGGIICRVYIWASAPVPRPTTSAWAPSRLVLSPTWRLAT